MPNQSANEEIGRHKNISPEEIQEAAIGIILEKGYHATSTADICRALGISKPTLYWHFKNKEALLFSVHKDHVDNLLKPILVEMDNVDDPLERLKFFIRRYVKIICTHRELKLLVDENYCLEPDHQKYVLDSWKQMLDRLRDCLRELKKNAVTKDINEGFVALNLVAMCTWPYNWFDYSRPEGITELTSSIEQMLFEGILK